FENGWWPKFSRNDLTKSLSVLTMEGVPEKVRQYLRGFYQQWEAQKRTGEEIPVGHADRTDLRRSRSGTWRKTATRIDEPPNPDISPQMFAVLSGAKKRLGDKAVNAFTYYLQGKSEKEAAQLAGITERTFRNYKTSLKQFFASKK